MHNLYEKILEAASFLQKQGIEGAQVAVILGSGLGAFADTLQSPIIVPCPAIPGFVASTVQGHLGRLVFGKLPNGARAIALQGRIHFYEGHSMTQITFATR